MAFAFEWLDNPTHVLYIALQEPFGEDDIRQLNTLLRPLANDTTPLYLLVDVEAFNLVDPMRFIALFDGIDNEQVAYHAQQSALAVVGGGHSIPMLLNLYGTLIGAGKVVEAFDNQAAALAWLSRKAAAQAAQAQLP